MHTSGHPQMFHARQSKALWCWQAHNFVGDADRASRGARLLQHAVPYPEQGALAQGVLRQVHGSGQLCCMPCWPLLRTIHFFSTKARCNRSCEGRLHS